MPPFYLRNQLELNGESPGETCDGSGSDNHIVQHVNGKTNALHGKKRFFTTAASLASFLGVPNRGNKSFLAFEDHFFNFEDVAQACRRAGLETCGLIVGVDFSASNEWQGRKTFSGRNLHAVANKGKMLNPYQKVISIIGRTLESFDDDNLIPAFGFGDSVSKGLSVFSFKDSTASDTGLGGGLGERLRLWGRRGLLGGGGGGGRGNVEDDGEESYTPCKGFREVLEKYEEIAQTVTLGGPTNFAPIIHKAVNIVKKLKKYHILIVIADGQVVEQSSTIQAIIQASLYPLSIVMVGVGDGPWETMQQFDDLLPERHFDNFQFVNFHTVLDNSKKHCDANFALHAMMEIPDQYKTIKALGYLD
ncbi:E3 ubiquitin-protein ligase rglg2-like [Plakobranchus ocellatus]|uniref:E3 ubiquitin-protein ligase rglg2-like n=1 Tax=Plakobranchus ocellatus TaxID=259542 RepID=A0AAV4CQC6_9GAST|nr:E3 ubiquitin-protein ligase rglg2-like [Plakobranchus ocellatus]